MGKLHHMWKDGQALAEDPALKDTKTWTRTVVGGVMRVQW